MDYTARDASPACPKTQSLNSWTTGLRLEDGVVTSRYRAGAATHRSKRGIRIPCSSSCAIIEVRLMRGPHAPDGGLDQHVAGAKSPDPDVLLLFLAQGVVAQQVHRALRKGKQGRPLPASLSERFAEPFSIAQRMQDID